MSQQETLLKPAAEVELLQPESGSLPLYLIWMGWPAESYLLTWGQWWCSLS